MTQHSPESSSFQLRGDGVEVTYSPSERLEVRNRSGLRVYPATALSIMPVALGHLVTARADADEAPGTTFSLLVSHVPPGGGAVSAVAITAPTGASWEAVALEGQAAVDATRAIREEAVRTLSTSPAPDASGEHGASGGKVAALGTAAAGAVSVDVAVDQLVRPDTADAAAPAADADADGELPVPTEGVTLYTHLGQPAAAEDDDAEPDPDDEQQSEEAEEGFLGGLTGLGDLGDGPHLPPDII